MCQVCLRFDFTVCTSFVIPHSEIVPNLNIKYSSSRSQICLAIKSGVKIRSSTWLTFLSHTIYPHRVGQWFNRNRSYSLKFRLFTLETYNVMDFIKQLRKKPGLKNKNLLPWTLVVPISLPAKTESRKLFESFWCKNVNYLILNTTVSISLSFVIQLSLKPNLTDGIDIVRIDMWDGKALFHQLHDKNLQTDKVKCTSDRNVANNVMCAW